MKIQGETSILEVGPNCSVEAMTLREADMLVHNASGSRPPLVMIRSWSHTGEYLLDLATHIGPDQPIYSIAPPNFDTLDLFPQVSAEWVDFIERRIRDLQLSGPLCLGGFSFGGVLAFETAERMRAKGERVLMLDTRIPQNRDAERAENEKRGDDERRLAHWLLTARRHIAEFNSTQDWYEAWQYARRRILGKRPARGIAKGDEIEVLREPGRQNRRNDPNMPEEKTLTTSRGVQMTNLKRTIQICYVEYQRQASTLPVAVLYTSDTCRRQRNDPSLGWGPCLEGSHQYIEVAGTHLTLFDAPNDKRVAKQIAVVLARAC